MIHVAIDAMGGDHAPAAIVDGAVAAARHLDIQISLVGAPDAVAQALDAHADCVTCASPSWTPRTSWR